MRKIFIAAIFVLFPLVGSAENVQNTTNYTDGLSRILLISAGVAVGVVIVDFLIGGAATAPVMSMTHPVMQQARTAGAVFGEQVTAATQIRDAQARASMTYAFLVGSGALLGGWLVDKFFIRQPEQRTIVQVQ